jgi:hypothetical protein
MVFCIRLNIIYHSEFFGREKIAETSQVNISLNPEHLKFTPNQNALIDSIFIFIFKFIFELFLVIPTLLKTAGKFSGHIL